jgi:hypothetical protein
VTLPYFNRELRIRLSTVCVSLRVSAANSKPLLCALRSTGVKINLYYSPLKLRLLALLFLLAISQAFKKRPAITDSKFRMSGRLFKIKLWT